MRCLKYRGMEQSVARRAHNPKVVGSSPSPATTKRHPKGCLFYLSNYENEERSSLGEVASASGGRRSEQNEAQWSKKSRSKATATEDFFGIPQEARSDNPKVVGSSPSPATTQNSRFSKERRLFFMP